MIRAILLAGFAALPGLAWGQGLPDLQGRAVSVVVENAYPPLQFIDPEGKAVGWEYDAMAEIAKRLNLTLSYQTTTWDAMIPAVAEGRYDIGMNGITIREDRMERVDFSDAYMHSHMRMITRADEARFSDAETFVADSNLLMAAQVGTTPFYVGVYEMLDGDEDNARVVKLDTFADGILALQNGDVDLVLSDSTAADAYVAASEGALKIVGEPLGAEDFGFIFSKTSDLLEPVNAAIAQMSEDGTFAQLSRRWFYEYKTAP